MFKNIEKNNYTPSDIRSPLVDAGKILSEYGIATDLRGREKGTQGESLI